MTFMVGVGGNVRGYAILAVVIVLILLLTPSMSAVPPIYPMDYGEANGSGRLMYSPADWADDVVSMKGIGRGWDVRLGGDGVFYIGTDWSLTAMWANGSVIWERTMDFPRLSLADDGTLRVCYGPGLVSSFSPNGTELWSMEVPGLNQLAVDSLISSSGRLYAGLDNRSHPEIAAGIVAIDPNGTIAWRFQSDGNVTTALALSDSGDVYFISSMYGDDHNSLYAVDENGSLIWKNELDWSWFNSYLSVGPEGTIYLVDDRVRVRAFDVNGTSLWTYEGVDTYLPVAVGQNSLITKDENRVLCLSHGGELIWNYSSLDRIFDYAIASNGYVLATTETHLLILDQNGELVRSILVIMTPNVDHDWIGLFDPIVDADGSIYLIYMHSSKGYLVHLGQGTTDESIIFKAWYLTGAMIACWILVLICIGLMLWNWRTKSKKDINVEVRSKMLLRTSTGLRFTGIIIAIYALSMVWLLISQGESGWYLDPEYRHSAFVGRLLMPPFVDLFLIAILVTLVRWEGAILGFLALNGYYIQLTELYGGGLLAWEGDFAFGTPYDLGFIVAWLSIIVIMISGLVRMYADGKIGLTLPSWFSKNGS